MTPGTDKIGAIGFCWGGRYAILQAHGQGKSGGGSDIGGVDAAYACHPSLVAVPADFDPVEKPLSLALGTKDSLLDQGTVGKIQDLMAKKTEVPHELRVSRPILLELSNHSAGSALTYWDSCMRTRFTDLRCAVIGVAIRIRRLWMSRRSRALSGSQSIYLRLICH